jgi:hypothetical protein
MFLSVLTKRAIAWVNDNLNLESWQIVGGNLIGVDRLYMDDVFAGLTDAGLQPNVDFIIY